MRLLRFDSLESTNEEARRLAASGVSGPVWISAREQTNGRGRRGKLWISQPGNLFATLLMTAPHTIAAQLGFAASLAAADVVASYVSAPRVSLKWPNDVLLDGRKVAGILLEALGHDSLAIGVGINLQHHPEGTETPAISVNAATGRAVAADDALAVLAARLAAWYAVWQGHGFAGLKPHWLKRASGLGRPVRARLAHSEIEGVFEDLDQDGALLLRTMNAGLTRITAAEVFFPPPLAGEVAPPGPREARPEDQLRAGGGPVEATALGPSGSSN